MALWATAPPHNFFSCGTHFKDKHTQPRNRTIQGTMQTSPRRSSLSVLTNKFETIIENAHQESRMARRASLAHDGKHVPRTTNRRSSLADRLSLFEAKIAENAQYAIGKGRIRHSVTTTTNSTPVKTYEKKVVLRLDEMPTPTTVTTTMTDTAGFSSHPTTHSTNAVQQSIPFHLCVPFDDHDGQSSQHSSLGAGEDLTLNGEDVSTTEDPAVVQVAVEKHPVLYTTNHADPIYNNDSHTVQDNDDSSDVYESTKMLVDWDYQQKAIRQRAAQQRKATINTGSRISLKDRMKAFS